MNYSCRLALKACPEDIRKVCVCVRLHSKSSKPMIFSPEMMPDEHPPATKKQLFLKDKHGDWVSRRAIQAVNHTDTTVGAPLARHFVPAVFWLVIFLGWNFSLVENPWSTLVVTPNRDVTFLEKNNWKIGRGWRQSSFFSTIMTLLLLLLFIYFHPIHHPCLYFLSSF